MRKLCLLLIFLTGCSAVKSKEFDGLVNAHNALTVAHNNVAECLYSSADLAAYKVCIKGK